MCHGMKDFHLYSTTDAQGRYENSAPLKILFNLINIANKFDGAVLPCQLSKVGIWIGPDHIQDGLRDSP